MSIIGPHEPARSRAAIARAAAVLLTILVAASACATSRGGTLPDGAAPAVATPGFDFARDTFAFPNEIRARHPEAENLYANYCFVLARALRQFFQFARFDPTLPKVSGDEYADRVRRIVAHPPWQPSLPTPARVVIPGYASLRDFSRGEEAAVKDGLGGRFWTLVHWTNWRVTWPVSRGHQEAVAREVVSQLGQGQLVQLLVTNWPKPELNHTVVAYAYRPTADGVELIVWDPNDPQGSGIITFERESSRFAATRVYDTEPGLIRVFRMYHSWLF